MTHAPTPYHHPACLSEEDLARQCIARAGKSSGPGGQHRNKVSTHIELTHTPTGLTAQAGERRSQSENKHVAFRRLRLTLAIHHRTQPPAPPPIRGKSVEDVLNALDGTIGGAGTPVEGCSALWRSRLTGTRHGRDGRIACNSDHADFPSLLAEALDMIAHHGWEPQPAAERLGVTTSQLIKLVKDSPEAMTHWNRQRAARNLHGLK